jgi:hypothetical protein
MCDLSSMHGRDEDLSKGLVLNLKLAADRSLTQGLAVCCCDTRATGLHVRSGETPTRGNDSLRSTNGGKLPDKLHDYDLVKRILFYIKIL